MSFALHHCALILTIYLISFFTLILETEDFIWYLDMVVGWKMEFEWDSM
ncbi:hypothetical protein KSS87_014801 [Heliosperma pusillum]|nr:hypothetical protein KSS87_014070 [Heliosperma pusillum]KAH9621593.1 hypothetical protein KSS87_016920 [Heliosperma pusillum]KAH9625105.1 hypothetical protein KSS87_018094 [Heliosperma pusillum]KAH9626023.1 hypothetical protein KSS87_014801 [Heliosperma pusillum]